MDEVKELYYKYEMMYTKIYDEVLDRFCNESYLKNKLNRNSTGEVSIIIDTNKKETLRKISFEEVKERIMEIWENKRENKKVTLDSEDVMKEIIDSVTLYFMAREVRKVIAHSR